MDEITRRGDSGNQAGYVGEIAAIKHQQQQVITAVQTYEGIIKLIAWFVEEDGFIRRTGDSSDLGEMGSSISIAGEFGLLSTRYVTAMRSSEANLFLIGWNVNDEGTEILRLGDSGDLAGEVDLIKIIALEDFRYLTAVRTSSGRLKLILWRLNEDGSISRLSDSGNQAGEVTEISIARGSTDEEELVVTAVKTITGRIKLISWRVANDGIDRLEESSNPGRFGSNVRILYMHGTNIITSIVGRLSFFLFRSRVFRIRSWWLNGSGNIEQRDNHYSFETIKRESDISVHFLPGNDFVISAHQTFDNDLKLVKWHVDSDFNRTISRIGDSGNQAGYVRLISMSEQLDDIVGVPRIITCVKTKSNRLMLIAWST